MTRPVLRRPRLPRLAALLGPALLLVPLVQAAAQQAAAFGPPDDPIIVIEVWTELDPLVTDGSTSPVPRDVAVERLLDEAQRIVSGMVYGYRVRYVPADPTRSVAEELDVEPVATIEWGDPRLTVFQTWVESDLLYARIFYRIDPAQAAWYRGWHGAAHARSTGAGTVPFIQGPAVKPQALLQGLKAAVREHVRRSEFNRPAAIEAGVLLASAPSTRVRAGSYETTVTILLQVDRIERYEAY